MLNVIFYFFSVYLQKEYIRVTPWSSCIKHIIIFVDIGRYNYYSSYDNNDNNSNKNKNNNMNSESVLLFGAFHEIFPFLLSTML